MLHEIGRIIVGPGVLDTTQTPLSNGLKPLPVIVTEVPAGPLLGVRVRDAVVVDTMKVAVAVSPVKPVTVTTYVPGVTGVVTVKVDPEAICPLVLMLHAVRRTMLLGLLKTLVHP
jgi:hypothetical protein